MWFCLRLDKIQHIALTEFRSIKWLATKERVPQWINAITFKFDNKNCPFYLNEIFEFALHCRIEIDTNSFSNLKHSFCKTNSGQKTLWYIGPSLSSNIPDDYLGLLLYYHYYYYYPQCYLAIVFLTNMYNLQFLIDGPQ